LVNCVDGFRYYVNSLGNYSAAYGSLSGMIVLMLFFYLSSLLVLFGAEVNAEVRRRQAHREPPTSIPARQP
jgi:membrane protein